MTSSAFAKRLTRARPAKAALGTTGLVARLSGSVRTAATNVRLGCAVVEAPPLAPPVLRWGGAQVVTPRLARTNRIVHDLRVIPALLCRNDSGRGEIGQPYSLRDGASRRAKRSRWRPKYPPPLRGRVRVGVIIRI